MTPFIFFIALIFIAVVVWAVTTTPSSVVEPVTVKKNTLVRTNNPVDDSYQHQEFVSHYHS